MLNAHAEYHQEKGVLFYELVVAMFAVWHACCSSMVWCSAGLLDVGTKVLLPIEEHCKTFIPFFVVVLLNGKTNNNSLHSNKVHIHQAGCVHKYRISYRLK